MQDSVWNHLVHLMGPRVQSVDKETADVFAATSGLQHERDDCCTASHFRKVEDDLFSLRPVPVNYDLSIDPAIYK